MLYKQKRLFRYCEVISKELLSYEKSDACLFFRCFLCYEQRCSKWLIYVRIFPGAFCPRTGAAMKYLKGEKDRMTAHVQKTRKSLGTLIVRDKHLLLMFLPVLHRRMYQGACQLLLYLSKAQIFSGLRWLSYLYM